MDDQSEEQIKTYSSKDLVEILQREGIKDITVRKIHYYKQIGVIPELAVINNRKYYTDQHLDCLRAIKTMKNTGESLNEIKTTLTTLDSQVVRSIGDRVGYYSTENLMSTDTYHFNQHVSFTFNKTIPSELKSDIIEAVSTVLKKHNSL